MPPRYFLRSLGTPELRGPTGEPIRFRTRKHLALLIYLTVEPRQHHRRDRLADLLWSETPHAEARHSLATALSVIRGKLGPKCYESTRDTVKLLIPDLEVDLHRLLKGDVLGDEFTPALEMAGFLDGFDIATSPEFMLWRDQTRAQLFPSIRTGFVTLMDRCRRTGAFAQIEPLADRLLELDGLNEDAIRAKMEARAFAGDRLSSLRIFQEWRERLQSELGAVPSTLVEGMALRLRQRGYEPPGSSHVPTVATDRWRDQAFVGRAEQYRAAYERWEETRQGRGRHVLVLGDSGIGKTTLVERLVTAAGLEGAVSARVQCYEVEREIPYAAVGTLVRGMLDRPGASATPPEWLGELAATVSAVSQRFPHLPPARESEGETARLRLTEAVHQLASAVADENPLILIIDDVHLADDASVAVLHLVMRRTHEQRVMVAMTARQAELAQSPNASRLLEVKQPLALESVELPALNEAEMIEVINSLALTTELTLPPAANRALIRSSAGNPMIAELLFDDWKSHGQECLALAVGAMTSDAYARPEEGLLARIVDRMFRGLSPAGKAVLGLAAILGERLNDLPMYELVDLTLAQTLAGMAELTELRVLRDGGRELEFRNELLRGRAYYNVPSPLRKALHGLIADRLLAAQAGGEHIPGLMLAWHCYRASRSTDAVPFLLKGAREAIRRGALFEVELALSSAMKGLEDEALSEAQLLLAEALRDQGRWQESIEAMKHIVTFTAAQNEWAASLRLLGRCALVADEKEGRELLKDVRQAAIGASIATRANLLVASQQLVYFIGDRIEAEVELLATQALLPLLKELPDRLAVVSSYAHFSWITRHDELLPEIFLELERLAAESSASGLLDSNVGRLHQMYGCALVSTGRHQDALKWHTSAYDLARLHGNEMQELHCAENLALSHCRLGNYAEQGAWAEKAIRMATGDKNQWSYARSTLHLANSLCMRGENTKAVAVLEGFPEDTWRSSRMWVTQATGLLRADVFELAGERERSIRLAMRTLVETDYTVLSRAYSGPLARWAGKLAIQQNDKRARDLLELIATDLSQHDTVDQAEILNAEIALANAENRSSEWFRKELLKRLEQLPTAVGDQIFRLQPIN